MSYHPAYSGLLLALFTLGAAHADPDIRDTIAGSHLGVGYAQLINLAATPDISASHYRVDGTGVGFKIDVARLPYETSAVALSPDITLAGTFAAGYLRLNQDLPLLPAAGDAGNANSTWAAASFTGGAVVRIQLGQGFVLAPGFNIGVARLSNHTDYGAAVTGFQPLLDGVLFNWHTNAVLMTPGLGLDWSSSGPGARLNVGGHVARSWISSFDASDPLIDFNQTANVYSLRAERVAPTAWHIAGAPVDWIAQAGYGGFFGADRNALGFDAIAEVGLGLQTPLQASKPNGPSVRFGASYLFGPGGRGWSANLGLQY